MQFLQKTAHFRSSCSGLGKRQTVTELLEGGTLRERLFEGVVPPRKAIEYAVQLATGLAAAHERGITHRDLKPENVFLTRDGRVKILDFGLAKVGAGQTPAPGASMEATFHVTSPGTVLGTVGCMSPEQVRGRSVDHRSDIFSLGAVLFEMLAGERAFTGESAVETMNAILKEDPWHGGQTRRGSQTLDEWHPAFARRLDCGART